MKHRLTAALLAFSLLGSLTGCAGLELPPFSEDPTVYSQESSENPYAHPSEGALRVIPDLSESIRSVMERIFRDAETCTCEPVFAATAIAAGERMGTQEARNLLSLREEDLSLEDPAALAQQVIALLLLEKDPGEYFPGLDLPARLASLQAPEGWFAGRDADGELPQIVEETPSPTADAEPTGDADVTSTPLPSPTGVPPEEVPEGAVKHTLWSVLALSMTHTEFDEAAAAAFLAASLHRDGGLAFDSELSDVSASALAVIALSGCGLDDAKTVFNGCMEYLIASYNDKGYFVGSSPKAERNVSDQAMGIAAVLAAGEDIYSERWVVKGRTMVDRLLDFRESGVFPEAEADDCSCAARALFAMLCAQSDRMYWLNYELPDIPVTTIE